MDGDFRKKTPRLDGSIEMPHQRTILQMTAVVCLIACPIFIFLNVSRQVYFLAFLEGLLALLAAGILWRSRHLKNTQVSSVAFVAALLMLVAYAASLSGSTATVFVWIFAVPGICYSVLGARQGFILSAAFFGFMGSMYLLKARGELELLTYAPTLNVIIVYFVIWGFCHIYESQRVRAYLALENLATRDPLTGLYNRRRMADFFEQAHDNSQHNGGKLGLIMIDLDFFKSINDKYGHDVGDKVLREVSVLLERKVRATDYVFRMGGEEFCVMLKGVSPQDLEQTAFSLRENIEALNIDIGSQILKVTASIGCTMVISPQCTLDLVMRRADKLLYAAKEAGRNRVVVGLPDTC